MNAARVLAVLLTSSEACARLRLQAEMSANGRQSVLEVPRVRRRSRRIHHRLRVPVVIECHHFGVADLLSLVTLSIALSACALMPSISYILPLESMYAGPSTFVARRLANWYSRRESAQYFSPSRMYPNSK